MTVIWPPTMSVVVQIATLLVVIIFTTVWLYLKVKRKNVSLTCEEILKLIQEMKIFPISPGQGWQLVDLWYEHRIWHTAMKSTTDMQRASLKKTNQIYGCYSKVKGSSQTVLKTVTDINTFPEWRISLKEVKEISEPLPEPQSGTPKTKTKPAENVTSQSDVICVCEDFVPSRSFRILHWISKWLMGNSTLKKTYRINRLWNKEDNGCCWLMELNTELDEWIYYLAQPVEKWFEIDQCLLTILYCPNKKRPRSVTRRPAELLTSLHNHILYRKIQCTPLSTITFGPEGVEKSEVAKDESAPESPSNSVTTSSKARTMLEDVISKFNKTEEGKSEPKFIQKFRNLLEEKKEWYEEKKRKAANKASEESAKAKEEVDCILGDGQIQNDQSEKEDVDKEDSGKAESKEPTKHMLTRAKTVDCIESIEMDSGAMEDDEFNSPGSSPSFGEKIKRKFSWADSAKKGRSLSFDTSSLASSKEAKDDEDQQKEAEQNKEQDGMEATYLSAGRHASTELLNMKSKIANIDIKLPYDQQAQKSGGWIYCGLEREVVILRKIYEEGAPIQSYLGKGLIPCPPKAVYETLKNPRTRFTYDEMLKKMDVLHEFDNGMKIIHWHHEVSQLFKRECRDFCILQHEQIEGSKYIISMRSVNWPECVETEDVTRATLHASGWIIEPAPKNNQLYSMVTYIVQMELGHSKTNSGYLVEELAAKQPLSIAFLRQYLVPTSNIPRPSGPSRRKFRGSSSGSETAGANLGSSTLANLAAQLQRPTEGNQQEQLADPPVHC